jgi:hypothetical protein
MRLISAAAERTRMPISNAGAFRTSMIGSLTYCASRCEPPPIDGTTYPWRCRRGYLRGSHLRMVRPGGVSVRGGAKVGSLCAEGAALCMSGGVVARNSGGDLGQPGSGFQSSGGMCVENCPLAEH